jgi:hypothetical protein
MSRVIQDIAQRGSNNNFIFVPSGALTDVTTATYAGRYRIFDSRLQREATVASDPNELDSNAIFGWHFNRASQIELGKRYFFYFNGKLPLL